MDEARGTDMCRSQLGDKLSMCELWSDSEAGTVCTLCAILLEGGMATCVKQEGQCIGATHALSHAARARLAGLG